mgnify:CR=1 FL=1
MPTVKIDCIATRYEVIGSGAPLLMFSPGGFDATLEKWSTLGVYAKTKMMATLTANFQCIVFDRRETGHSGGRVAAALQDAALEIGADIDRQLLGGDVAVDIGGRDQLDLLAVDRADDAAANFKIVGRDIALDGAGLADDQTADADVALYRAINLQIAAARNVAFEL